MSIDRYEDRIVAYLDGELPELERREVEAVGAYLEEHGPFKRSE